MNSMNPIVSKKWLLARMYESDLVIVDCRFELGNPTAGREAFAISHIPGAVYLDLEADLSSPVGEHGGRHPLPDPDVLAQNLGRVGISNDKVIVAYDDQDGMYASRLWWLLRWLGHDSVFVMDEGFGVWKDSGYPVTDAQPVIIPSSFIPAIRHEMLADVKEVQQSIGNSNVLLVDSRDASRYVGEQEPIDAKAGHIPGAINSFWKQVLDDHGAWKSDEQLREHFSPITEAMDTGREAIIYCGSGVSACPNVLALHKLGYPTVRLYAGSWSDWVSYPENPVATGEE
ncbi:thiosulfate sulfurtransferase [Paenibacillus segetis]|uniref:Thiosulfate sulfurtransferase n=2 Tax=Paenibacillus segetis TaxID=1325360 RepID=A0ABQ1Y2I5_9BACL|nr:thiosulfate sulfurtransferase [Paenibacillus segetis]